MLRRLPDIRKAELAAMAQSERIGSAKADLYPYFALYGTLGLHATRSGSQSYLRASPSTTGTSRNERVNK